MIELLAFVLVGVGLGEFVAWLGIIFRYAIPRAPLIFHILLTIPMLVASFSVVSLAYVALYGQEATVLGLDGITLLAIYFIAQACTSWVLNFYAFYWYLKGKRCPA